MPESVPIAPSLEPVLEAVRAPREDEAPNKRTLWIATLAIGAAFLAGFAAQLLTRLIGLITNLAFYGRWSTSFVSPAGHSLGMAVVAIPIIGALIVGVIARYGSAAVRGHGIPEAMEQVLLNESRISPAVMLLKPLSAAISIGTGGPFGAEGPIIATGGALGSFIGQIFHTTADERKTLLAAGAAAGMAATFGSPVSAVLLAVELLLFEYRPRSLIPVSLAAATAAGVRIAFVGSAPVLPMPDIVSPSGEALATYIVLGAAMGVVAIIVTRGLYGVEDAFEHLPIHWMWWPALGAIVVGIIGYFAPRTLGVGYENIEQVIAGSIAGKALLMLVIFKLISWIVALGSGTSGGTLAPLFTIGGGVGALVGGVLAHAFPSLGIDPRIGALVGMAAIFAGASHAVLASVVFAFEVTRQPLGLLPLLAGCSAAYLVSLIGMRHSIMTEKLARRGTPIRSEYAADYLEQILVRDIATDEVVTLSAEEHVEEVRDRIAARAPGSQHQGFPVVNGGGELVGVVTRRDLLDLDMEITARVGDLVTRSAVVIFDDSTAREAADHMVHERVGRLPVVSRANPRRVLGIVSRSDLLEAHERRLHARHRAERTIDLGSSLGWVRPTER